MDSLGQLGRDVGLDRAGDVVGNVARAQTGQGQPLGDRLAGQRGQRLGQRVVGGHLGVAVGRSQQDPGVPQLGRQELEQAHRGGVSRMEVVDDQQQRLVGGQPLEEAGDGVVQPEAGRLGVDDGDLAGVGHQLLDLGHELGQLGGPAAQRGPQPVAGPGGQQVPQDL